MRVVGALDGKVAIITGAARGIGREHALLFAAEGAKIVVNDLGGGIDGAGGDVTPAQAVVDELTAIGAEAITNGDDCASWEGAEALVQSAIDGFGRLDVLVNNAGILRDRRLVNMTEAEWDDVIRVHLKGHAAPLHFAARHWRERSKAGESLTAAVVNTSSTSGLLGNVGQTNYGAAKAGIGALTVIAAQELAPYGVKVNGIAPAARTRLTEQTPGLGDVVRAPNDPARFDIWDPANISPLVAWLATDGCPCNGQMFFIQGGTIRLFQNWTMTTMVERDDRWTIADIDAAADQLLGDSQPAASS